MTFDHQDFIDNNLDL